MVLAWWKACISHVHEVITFTWLHDQHSWHCSSLCCGDNNRLGMNGCFKATSVTSILNNLQSSLQVDPDIRKQAFPRTILGSFDLHGWHSQSNMPMKIRPETVATTCAKPRFPQLCTLRLQCVQAVLNLLNLYCVRSTLVCVWVHALNEFVWVLH